MAVIQSFSATGDGFLSPTMSLFVVGLALVSALSVLMEWIASGES